MRNLNVSDRTVHNYFICFKAVLNIAVKDGLIDKNPAQNIKTKFASKEKHMLDYNQLQKLVHTPCRNVQLKNAFLFSCYTGLRKSDIIKLRKKNIKGDYLVVVTEKTKTPIKVKLHKVALKILEEQKKLISNTVRYCNRRGQKFDNNRIFSIQTGGRSTKNLREWFKSAGVESQTSTSDNFYTFHTSRHTFVSNIVRYTGNATLAQKLVGHEDLKTTQIYIHSEQELLDSAIDSLPIVKE